MFTLLRPGTGALRARVFMARHFIWQRDEYPATAGQGNEKHGVCDETHRVCGATTTVHFRRLS